MGRNLLHRRLSERSGGFIWHVFEPCDKKKKKKTTKSLFDVTMGSFDGAETCELVGSYLLSKLAPEYGNDIGL